MQKADSRVKTNSVNVFGEILNEPTTIEEYDEALRSMVEDVKAVVRRKKYRQIKDVLMRDLEEVFHKYGHH
jgi:hypothetical protein